jgi:phosphodiesterase/alkaline phosphatase D-like protein
MHKSTVNKVFLTGLLISILLTFAGMAVACRSDPSNIPDQIILSWTGAPTDTQSITWHTEKPSQGFVQYVKDADYRGSWLFSEKHMIKAKRETISKGQYYRYEADLDSLKPGTPYRYRVGNKGNWSEAMMFHTAKTDADPFSFLYMGDVQYETRKKDYEAWGRLLNGAYKNHPEIAFGIIGGDLVDSSDSLKDWKAFFYQATSVFSDISLMPVPGNHDSSDMPRTYLKMLALPHNGEPDSREEFYSFDYGQCHIVELNSCIFMPEREKALGHKKWLSMIADTNKWIKEDLSSSKARWKIVVMHHPAYEIADDNEIFDLLKAN